MVCLGGYGTHWVPSVQLDELCVMLWDMARYHNYDIRSPYNRDAALWVASQTDVPVPDRCPPAPRPAGRAGPSRASDEPASGGPASPPGGAANDRPSRPRTERRRPSAPRRSPGPPVRRAVWPGLRATAGDVRCRRHARPSRHRGAFECRAARRWRRRESPRPTPPRCTDPDDGIIDPAIIARCPPRTAPGSPADRRATRSCSSSEPRSSGRRSIATMDDSPPTSTTGLRGRPSRSR